MSKANIAIKYRIYPTDEQAELINKTIGSARFVYNTLLDIANDIYHRSSISMRKYDYNYILVHVLKDKFIWLTEVDKFALESSCEALNNAFQKFFKGAGFPKHKSKRKSKLSYTTKMTNNNISIYDDSIKLPKLGKVKTKIHRTIDNATIKTATVSQDTDGKYYCSVLYEYDLSVTPKSVTSDKTIGLDMNDKTLYVDSNGNTPEKPKHKDMSKSLKREQRKLSHMIESHITGYKNIKGKRIPVYDNKLSECKNIQKQRKKIAKIHKKEANQRMDFLHKTSNQITNDYSLICIEDLSVKEMMLTKDTEESAIKRHNINRKTLSNGWYNFTEMLTYKAQRKGGTVIKVPKDYPSSQMCSICGNVNQEITDLHIRKWVCPVCNKSHDRDINAAINIRNKGFQMYSEV